MFHPTALIDPAAQIDPTAEIGPYVIIEGPASIGPRCRLLAHSQLIGRVTLGADCEIGRGAIVGAPPQDLGFDTSIDSGVEIGPRCTLREHVTIHRSSRPGGLTQLGSDNFLMVGCHLGHDVQLGSRNIVANAALLAGHVQVGSGTFIGGSAVFHQFIRIGDACVIQGNGSFSKDIPHFCCAQRINRITGLNIIGLRRQGFTSTQRAELKRLFALLFRSGQNLSQAIHQARTEPWSEQALRLLDFVNSASVKGVCALRSGRDDE
jgi:UDP-N-acetylglucosamine acyltransferase